MSLDYHELFRQMANTPQVQKAVEDKAEELKKFIEIRWPDVNDVGASTKRFLKEDPGDVVKVTHATHGTNRPTHIVTVRHPGAVAKQAKDGLLTKAVKDVS